MVNPQYAVSSQTQPGHDQERGPVPARLDDRGTQAIWATRKVGILQATDGKNAIRRPRRPEASSTFDRGSSAKSPTAHIPALDRNNHLGLAHYSSTMHSTLLWRSDHD